MTRGRKSPQIKKRGVKDMENLFDYYMIILKLNGKNVTLKKALEVYDELNRELDDMVYEIEHGEANSYSGVQTEQGLLEVWCSERYLF